MGRITACIILTACSAAAQDAVLRRLQDKVAVQQVANATPQSLAGKYSSPAKEIGAMLTGDDLFLFPDGKYIYDEWATWSP